MSPLNHLKLYKTNMQFLPIVSKARKPRFEVHLKIYDLNNVPLVSGVSTIKWHLPHSIHSEHRGRTHKSPILNHRVEYNYSKVVSVRIGIDRNSNLVECPVEFEVLHEYSGPSSAGLREEKISLGVVRLNLSEYVEESEAILREGTTSLGTAPTFRDILASPPRELKSAAASHHRKRSSLSHTSVPEGILDTSPRSSHASEAEDENHTTSSPMSDVQDGVVRRYLMQESKINSTLKISILMIQVDGERNYAAPPPKSAPVFGGIAGFVSGDALEPVDTTSNNTAGHVASTLIGKSRDVFELQDMYRRALAASWASQPGELPADECIEDIFAGGDGFVTPPSSGKSYPRGGGHTRHQTLVANGGRRGDSSPDDRITGNSHVLSMRREDSGSVSDEEENSGNGGAMGTLRPRDMHRLRSAFHHFRHRSDSSDRSTVLADRDRGERGERERDLNQESSRGIGLGVGGNGGGGIGGGVTVQHRREESKITHAGGLRSRSSSMLSMAPSNGSNASTTTGRDFNHHRGGPRDGFKRVREVDEFDIRDDLVAWTVPEGKA
ncbi:N-terminal C2 in EEIG1 and EHBP1 proteins-domain-containing protein [Podospora australis]|uniref:N-terminal C2 in EEIG1 and EHBP1 proteins-domain-containing protein n=1 Tax=Podospora australis TaxID=1536484 RepID=A0AAN7AIJ0_9PEZI|nr:N-terminal C2 in EEIG1 and EHBP1 proteins-domain-containing protein [Podospora australis]